MFWRWILVVSVVNKLAVILFSVQNVSSGFIIIVVCLSRWVYYPVRISLSVDHALVIIQGCHSFHAPKMRRFEEIWGGITNIFEEICQNLAQNLRRIEEIWHMYVLVNLTLTDVMSSNITVYSRRNTTLTVGKKWTFNMKLCNLYFIILTIWTHIICTWTNTLSH